MNEANLSSAGTRSVLVCIECHIEVCGIARVGMPCPFCDGYIVDLHDHIRAAADRCPSDPAKQIVRAIENAKR